MLDSYERRDRETWVKYFDATYTESKWTKIPGGRLVITLPEDKKSTSFHLDFESATGSVEFEDGSRAEAFFSATKPVAMLRLPPGAGFELVRPESIDQLEYPQPDFSRTDYEVAYRQRTSGKLSYAFVVQWKEQGSATLVAIALCSSHDDDNPLALARSRAAEALDEGWASVRAPHVAWWKTLYNSSDVTIPDPRLQNHYNLVRYFYGAASRAHAPPMPLQGVWTADAGGLPPWKGDYHNDLNTQMTYVAWQAAGLTDPGMSYLNYFWDRLPQFREYGRDFFGVDGAMVPGVMTLDGQAMGGWPQYAMSPTAGLWNGHAFYQYWKTSGDMQFLAERAYPWLNEVATSVFALANIEDGVLTLPLSSSPEWNDDRWEAYLTPNSNNDQALLMWSAEVLEEMAVALGRTDEAKSWADKRALLAPLKIDPATHALLVSEGIPFDESHRHFAHTMAIHPLGILNVEQSPEARRQVRSSVRQLIDYGSQAWVGYSFTWAASLAARAGFPDDCVRLLTDFERAFVTRNGFHVNGDQTKSGLSSFQYRPFTLEGNFLFMDAIHEMYLQSWGGRLRIFPALPDSWREAEFRDLRAEGGFKVSAKRIDGQTQTVTIDATADGALTLRDPFPGRAAEWSHDFERAGEWLIFSAKAGARVQGVLKPG